VHGPEGRQKDRRTELNISKVVEKALKEAIGS